MQPLWLRYKYMSAIKILQEYIGKVGVKEVARRTHISASTVSRIRSGLINPSFQAAERIIEAVGLHLEVRPDRGLAKAPRLSFAKDVIGRIRNQLRSLGVRHCTIYGSVARGEDSAGSDIDVYLDFGVQKPKVAHLLKAEGTVLEAFGGNKVDVVSDLSSPRGQRLKRQIEKDGVRVF